MSLFSISEITGKAQNTFKRFPLTLLWTIIGTFICIVIVDDSTLFDAYSGLILTLLLGISWLIGTQFVIEQTANPKKWRWLKLLVLALLFVFYWFLPEGPQLLDSPLSILRFFLFFISGHLFVFFAPFLIKWNKEAYWNYLKSVGVSIIRSGFFAGVLYLGLVLALLALDALFGMSIPGKLFGQLFIFCAGIVNTWIYLSDFPKNIQNHKKIHFNKALEVFVKYILIPLVILYLVILYAYSFKIFINWELPKGWVSYLVTALAILGFIVQVIINPIQKTLKAWTIRIFNPFFYIMLIPLIALLFAAIFRRISDYGITENRYFIIVLALWILGMSLYLLLAKNKRLIVLPITLFFLAIVSSFGYWGAFSVSMRSQVGQFKKVLEVVRSNDNKASGVQYDQLRSILDFTHERQSLSKLDPITNIAMEETFMDTTGGKIYGYRWLDTQRVIDSMGISISVEDQDSWAGYGKSYNYYVNSYQSKRSFPISDFDYFASIQLNQYTNIAMPMGELSTQYNKEKAVLSFRDNNDSTEVFQLHLRKKLLELTKYDSDIPEDALGELTLDFENERILGKLIFMDLGYEIINDSINITHSNAYLFLKQR